MCGLQTRPRTDVDPPRFCHRRTAIGGGGEGGAYRLAAPGGDTLLYRVLTVVLLGYVAIASRSVIG